MTRLSAQALVVVCSIAGAGCASRARLRSQQSEIDQLKSQLAAVQRAQNDQKTEQESIKNEMFILHDRVETARTILARTSQAPPKLEVVKLAPAPSNDPLAIRVKPAAPRAGLASDAANAAGDPDLSSEEYDPSADEAAMFVYSGDDGAAANASDVVRLAPPTRPDNKPVMKKGPLASTSKKNPVVVASNADSMAVVGAGDVSPVELASAPSAPKGDPMKMYQKAFALFQAKNWNDAQLAFQEFVNAFPTHEYADNAYYWMGECWYTQQEYALAIGEFQKIPELYPGGNKVPDALLKIGISYEGLTNKKNAEKTLKQLVDAYPQSSAAVIARTRLAKLSEQP